MHLTRHFFATSTMLLVLAALCSPMLAPSPAAAAGYGVYFDYAFGDITTDPAYLNGGQLDTSRLSMGFTLDTAVAKDKLFNYRLNLGYEQVRDRVGDVVLTRFNGASFENVFGFGVYRSPLMRVWLGPSFRIAGGVLDESSFSGGPIAGSVIRASAGGGVAVGINIHTGNIGSAAFTIGYQIAYNGTYGINTSIPTQTVFHGRDNRVNFNFAYYFRGRGERFDSKGARPASEDE